MMRNRSICVTILSMITPIILALIFITCGVAAYLILSGRLS